MPHEKEQNSHHARAKQLNQYSADHIKVYSLHHWDNTDDGKTRRQWNLSFNAVPNPQQIQDILERAQQLYPTDTNINCPKVMTREMVFYIVSRHHAGCDPMMFATRRWLGYIRNTNLGLVAINGQNIHDWRDYLWDDLPDEQICLNDN